MRRYPQFVADLEAATGHVVGLRREGTLIAATDAGDREMLVELHAFQTELGLDATMLAAGQVRELEPMVSPDVRCGLLVRSDHSVDNRRLTGALLAALDLPAVDLVSRRVASVTVEAGRAAGVVLDNGDTVNADAVVVAAGPWSGELAGIPPRTIPVRPVKGQILRLQARQPRLLPGRSIRGFVNGHEIYLIPRADGELVVGATVEEVGFDATVRAGAVRELLRDAHAVMPSVDELELVEACAALRPGSPDNAPLIGDVGIDGLTVASGHHRNGILLAPLTADLVAAMVTGTLSDEDRRWLAVATPARFGSVSSAR
jgi:glycine oxidase